MFSQIREEDHENVAKGMDIAKKSKENHRLQVVFAKSFVI